MSVYDTILLLITHCENESRKNGRSPEFRASLAKTIEALNELRKFL